MVGQITGQLGPGSQNYSFRELSCKYDSNGAFLGPLVLTANVELTSANSFKLAFVSPAATQAAFGSGLELPGPPALSFS